MAATSAVIAKGITVKGDLVGDGDMVVEGSVQGRVKLEAALTVASGGSVHAEISARRVMVAGTVEGPISASETIALTATADVTGDLRAPSIAVEPGARLRGRIDMQLDLPEDLHRR